VAKPARKRKRTRPLGKLDPEILIFDVDGVLVDVRETYWRSGLQTVQHLTGKKPTWTEFYEWKRQPGNNDDWTLVSRWATALGVPTTYEEARDAFQPFYWGRDGQPGNVSKEKLLITPKSIARWAARRELNLFTGRTRQEFSYTFDKLPAARSRLPRTGAPFSPVRCSRASRACPRARPFARLAAQTRKQPFPVALESDKGRTISPWCLELFPLRTGMR